ncbi:hydroxyacylglutathione hydrolase [Phycomyces nitens]|nr:hydroxyacylglutathione hydrolase [Phycomyces nitens]
MHLSRLLSSYINRRTFSSSAAVKMIITPVPCLKDNYAYLLLDEQSKKAMVVDPVEPDNVLGALKANYPEYSLTGILTTHHHWDHAGGNSKLLHKLPKPIPCYGGSDNVTGVSNILNGGETIELGSLTIKSMPTYGHTMDHMCYHVVDKAANQQAVFTGDCLFSSGCGRLFEGSPGDMWEAMVRLKALPKDTKVYFGHEYTRSNLKFAEHIEPNNPDIQAKISWANETECTTPSTIKNELATNPFMRADQSSVRDRVTTGKNDSLSPEQVLGIVRSMKDNF